MITRLEAAKEVGFNESKDGLLNWFDSRLGLTIFLDFRVEGDEVSEDMPPVIYAAKETGDDEETVWIDDSGSTKKEWKNNVKNHWVVKQMEEKSGVKSNDGQSMLKWYGDDGLEQRRCSNCNEMVNIHDIEDGLCVGDSTNGCYYDENPSEVFRKAKRRKEKIRSNKDNIR